MNTASVRTPYIKAIVSSDPRHALARLTSLRRLDTRYTNTTHSTKMGHSLTSGFWSFVCNWWWFSREVLDRWDQCSLEAWNSIKWFANEINVGTDFHRLLTPLEKFRQAFVSNSYYLRFKCKCTTSPGFFWAFSKNSRAAVKKLKAKLGQKTG